MLCPKKMEMGCEKYILHRHLLKAEEAMCNKYDKVVNID